MLLPSWQPEYIWTSSYLRWTTMKYSKRLLTIFLTLFTVYIATLYPTSGIPQKIPPRVTSNEGKLGFVLENRLSGMSSLTIQRLPHAILTISNFHPTMNAAWSWDLSPQMLWKVSLLSKETSASPGPSARIRTNWRLKEHSMAPYCQKFLEICSGGLLLQPRLNLPVKSYSTFYFAGSVLVSRREQRLL
jgi:hypothetical protein